MDIDKNIRLSEIISKKIAGEITPEESEYLERWLSASERNSQLYDRLVGGESRSAHDEWLRNSDMDLVWDMIQSKIRRRNARRLSLRAASISISISAIAAIAVLVIFNLTNRDNVRQPVISQKITLMLPDGRHVELLDEAGENEWMDYIGADNGIAETGKVDIGSSVVKIQVGRGKRYKLGLPDGSLVWLNSESVIEYPARFDGVRRKVVLTGEAYFDVVRDTIRPFEVEVADKISVRVSGTKFNVDGHADSEQIRVSLIEGSVAVGFGDQSIMLRPNQQAVFIRGEESLTLRELTDAAIYASWIDGNVDYQEERLDAIFVSLGKRFDVEFIYSGSDLSLLGHFTVHADADDLADVCRVLGMITGLKYEIKGRYVYVTDR